MKSISQRVAVLGASDDPERYANKALKLLQAGGHTVLPVTPRPIKLDGLVVYSALAQVPPPIDTVTLYVNPRVLETVAEEIIAVRPTRVIFNPGTEHAGVAERLRAAGIATLEACTIVLLRTGQFA